MNIGEKLKSTLVPSGTKFHSPIFGTLKYVQQKNIIGDNTIVCLDCVGIVRRFTNKGKYIFHDTGNYHSEDVMIFPENGLTWNEYFDAISKESSSREKSRIEPLFKAVRIPLELYIHGTPHFITSGLTQTDAFSIGEIVNDYKKASCGFTLDNLLGEVAPRDNEIPFFEWCKKNKARVFVVRRHNKFVGYVGVC